MATFLYRRRLCSTFKFYRSLDYEECVLEYPLMIYMRRMSAHVPCDHIQPVVRRIEPSQHSISKSKQPQSVEFQNNCHYPERNVQPNCGGPQHVRIRLSNHQALVEHNDGNMYVSPCSPFSTSRDVQYLTSMNTRKAPMLVARQRDIGTTSKDRHTSSVSALNNPLNNNYYMLNTGSPIKSVSSMLERPYSIMPYMNKSYRPLPIDHSGTIRFRRWMCKSTMPGSNREGSSKKTAKAKADENLTMIVAALNEDEKLTKRVFKSLDLATQKLLVQEVLHRDIQKGQFDAIDANKDNVVTRDEWEQFIDRKANTNTDVDVMPPTMKQSRDLFIRSGAPFVVFGFVDNLIMISAGEAIDQHLGVKLGISTMAAAGIGNMLSDVVGTSFGGIIQTMADKLRLPHPHMSSSQLQLRTSRMIKHAACVVGICFGCTLGMSPLFLV